jgi:O-antigen/teichoic acid export membrane protein
MATVLIAAVVAMLVVHNLDVGIFPLCIGLSLFAIYFDLLRGIERFQAMAVFYVTANVVQLALVLVAALIHIYSVTLVVTAFGLSCVPPLLAIELQRRSPIHFQVRMLSRRILRELTVFSLPVLLAHAAYTAWYAGDLLVVQHFLGMAAGANYALTKTITLIFIFVPYATTTAVLPRFVHAETRNGGAYLRAMLFATAVTSLCLLLVLALAGNIMLHFAFHHKYADASLTLLPVSLGMALYSLYIVLESWVVSRGRPVVHAIAMTIMAVVTLGGDAILVPMYGPKGAGEGFVLGAAAGLVTIGAAAPLTRSRQKRTAVSSIDATTVAVEPQPSSPVEEESPPKDVSSVKTSSARGFPARRTIAHVMSQECGAEIAAPWTILGTPRKENGSSAVSVRCTPRHPGRRRRGLRRSAVADHVE